MNKLTFWFLILIVLPIIIWFTGGYFIFKYVQNHPEYQHSTYEMLNTKHKKNPQAYGY